MKQSFYSTAISVHITREQAREFVLEDPDNFADFILAYNTDAVIDYIKCNPSLLNKFILDGGLSEEDS